MSSTGTRRSNRNANPTQSRRLAARAASSRQPTKPREPAASAAKPATTRAVQSIAQHRLPYEIAVKIFSELLPTNAEQEYPHTFFLRRRGRMPSWLTVAHVCRYWRSVAFNCRSLWSYIPLENPAWTALALERSKPGPIHIDCGPDVAAWNLADPAALQLALMNAPRAQHISVTTRESKTMSDSLELLRAADVPQLQRLELLFFNMGGQPMPMVPLDIFRRAAPPILRTLILLDVFVAPRTNIFAETLTHLEMSIFTPAWDNLSQTFDTLAGLPHLEYLALMRGSVLPPWHKGDPWEVTGPRTLQFDRLKTLRLNGDACVVLRTLQTINAPNVEVGCLVFGLERDPGGLAEDPAEIAAGMTHPRWPGLSSIPATISSTFMCSAEPSKTLRSLTLTSAMDPLWSSIEEMTGFLRSVPQLQSLTMRCSPWHEVPLPPDASGSSSIEPVHLDYLETLHLWSRFPDILSTISDYIDVPDNTERIVTIDGGPPDGMAVRTFTSLMHSIFQLEQNFTPEDPSYQHIEVLELKDDFYFGVHIKASNPTPPILGQAPLAKSMELNIPLFTLGRPNPLIPPPEVVTRLAELTAKLVNVFPLHACNQVSVEHLIFEDLDMWTNAFIHLKNVTMLCVRPGPRIARTASRALCVTRLPGVDVALFPDLAKLHLEQVDFADPSFTPCPFQISPDRPEKNLPKFALEVSDSFVNDEILSVLKHDFVYGVRWDGKCCTSMRQMDRRWRRELPSSVIMSRVGGAAPIVPIAITLAAPPTPPGA